MIRLTTQASRLCVLMTMTSCVKGLRMEVEVLGRDPPVASNRGSGCPKWDICY